MINAAFLVPLYRAEWRGLGGNLAAQPAGED
jgi:hypothetical protein